jgi:hypothetical protein
MLEVVVALTLVAVVVLASVQLVTRAVAQIGSARTEQAERPARAKTMATQWVQAELEYLRSLQFIKLQRIALYPAGQTPPWSSRDGTAYRDITPDRDSLAPGEMPLPPGFERARVAVEVEALEPPNCTSDCTVASLRIRVALYRQASDLPGSPSEIGNAFVYSATSLHRP